MAKAVSTQVGEIDGSALVDRPRVDARFFAFYSAVVAVQGVHVVEHIIQLIQVYVLGIPDKDALGLLGYVFAFQGTEEWLHLVFNSLYLASVVVIAWGFFLWPAARSIVPGWALVAFLVLGLMLELWHVTEHIVIISHVVANNGCPCPGIVDAQLGVSDTVLHFGYNLIAYVGTVIPFGYLLRNRLRSAEPH